ncbi:hypothetical protein ACFYVR_03205 [Rhodococcus sp. NPDC003318]|uniref:hypothetical protein n=1 Tax=Rhodococcus sp. NPDC003318 TaxID=3364503 RepID=UPI0036AFDDF4
MPAAPILSPPPGAVRPPSARSPLSRRTALKWGAAALGVATAATATGCAGTDDDQPAEPDPLRTALDAAQRDAAAAAAASALAPERAAALSVIAVERTAHADALSAEIARAAGQDPSTTSTTAAATTTAPVTPPTIDELRTMLARSQRGAADLARRVDGHRAGLLGSISAAVAAEQAVMLL